MRLLNGIRKAALVLVAAFLRVTFGLVQIVHHITKAHALPLRAVEQRQLRPIRIGA